MRNVNVGAGVPPVGTGNASQVFVNSILKNGMKGPLRKGHQDWDRKQQCGKLR